MEITIEELKALASRLKFEMKDEEYKTLVDEFHTIIKQMDLISQIDGIDQVEPMTFPFDYETASWREDEVEPALPVNEVLANASDKTTNMIKVKKVVG